MSYWQRLSGRLRRLHQLEHDDPTLNAESWFLRQPVWCISAGARQFVLSQPGSTFWVYLLGLVGCALGAHFLDSAQGDLARYWWAIAMWLWGAGALIAGTSYQALGYHLKCRNGRVQWTTWLEVIYLICQQWSVNALLIAVAYSSTTGVLRLVLLASACFYSIIYAVVTLLAAMKPDKRWLTFEWMCLVSLPPILLALSVNLWNVWGMGSVMDAKLVGIWLGLFVSMYAYTWYGRSGIGEQLWQRRVWFSDNDVLHVTLLLWMGAIAWIGPEITMLPGIG